MTELDFIPQWYRAGRNRKLWHQRQCVMIGLVIVAIACGFMAAGRSLTLARAELSVMRSEFDSGISKIQRFQELQAELSELQKDVKILEAVRPRTPYTAALAELTHCISPNVILNKLTIRTVPPDLSSRDKVAGQKQNRVQLSGSTANSATPGLLQTEVILQGIALNGSTVAELIAALEQSEYFCRVIPGYSKNAKVRDFEVSEFEVRCVLADFEVIQ
jgi:Tfp pilus assembly protein PilN